MLGDNISSLKKLPDNSIDSVVTDPPYGLSFMNKKWDYDVPSVEFWKEVYRVLKPGGHVLSFGGTRTYHRMVVNIEDAGFEIRDQIMWIYGSGFPKSLNIGKAVDKMEGNEREVVGNRDVMDNTSGCYFTEYEGKTINYNFTKGTSPYEGWGTALKPANEPICVARKPLSEKSVAENVIKWGTGGINIDGCRISTDDKLSRPVFKSNDTNIYGGGKGMPPVETLGNDEGRFPANLIFECICDEVIKGEQGEVKETQPRNKRFDPTQHNSKSVYEAENGFTTKDYNDSGDIHTNPDCPCRMLDEQSGVSKSVGGKKDLTKSNNTNPSKITNNIKSGDHFSDKGGASRFFYNAKVSKSERNMICDEVIKGDIHTNPDCPCRMLDEQGGLLKSGKFQSHHKRGKTLGEYQGSCYGKYNNQEELLNPDKTYGDKGGASRFFYNAKVSKSERNMGLDGFEEKVIEGRDQGQDERNVAFKARTSPRANTHPTIKPINLMTYLCRLVTPKNGIVLDPFMGSGSTGIAAQLEGFRFCGMEMDEDYFKISEARINSYESYRKFVK